MAGILMIVAWRLIDWHHIADILRTSKRETAVLLTTFLATLFLELEFAIYAGVLLSLVIYLMRTSRPGIVARVPDPAAPNRHLVTDPKLAECPQLKIVRIDGSLFFGAVDHVQNVLHQQSVERPEQRHLLVIGNGINFIDIAGAELLVQEARRRRALGGDIYLAKVKEEVCEILRRGGFAEKFGHENIFATKSHAIATIVHKLDPSVCAQCDKRIFLECRDLPAPAAVAEKPAA
jgi:SulP family sulfate permease